MDKDKVENTIKTGIRPWDSIKRFTWDDPQEKTWNHFHHIEFIGGPSELTIEGIKTMIKKPPLFWAGAIDYSWAYFRSYRWSDLYLAKMEIDAQIAMTVKPVIRYNVMLDIDLADPLEVEVSPIAIYPNSKTIFEGKYEMKAHGVKVKYSRAVMSARTEMDINVTTSERDYLRMMLDYLPPYEKDNSVFRAVLSTYANEFVKAEQELSLIKLNMSIDTAVEMLGEFERRLGISYASELDYRQRREQIISYLRGITGQSTLEEIKNIASSYVKGSVEVVETEQVGVFNAKFVDEVGVPDNIRGLSNAINNIIPAHLEFQYEFKYNTWEITVGARWSSLVDMTWRQLREDIDEIYTKL